MKEENNYTCCIAADSFLLETPSNFQVPYLNFFMGERLRILQNNGDWCYGCLDEEPELKGIFPSNFIFYSANDFDVIKQPNSIEIFEGDDESRSLLNEITNTVRNWWAHIRNNFDIVNTSSNYDKAFSIMEDLIVTRKRILLRSIPAEEIKEFKNKVYRKIDIVDNILGLEMKIHDDYRRIIEPGSLSILETYEEHVSAYEEIKNITQDNMLTKIKGNFGLFFRFHSTTISVNCDVEIKVSLYDCEKNEFYSESYVFVWNYKTGTFYDSYCQLMFVELDDTCKESGRVFVVFQVSKISPLENKIPNKRTGNPEVWGRQPLAFGMKDIYSILENSIEGECGDLNFKLDKVWSFDYFSKGDKTLRPERNDAKIELMCTTQIYKGHLNQIREIAFKLFSVNPTVIIPPIKHLEVVWEDDPVNEFFLTLINGDFNGFKVTDKSIEVRIQVMDEKGNTLMNSIEYTTPNGTQYKSIHESNVIVGNDKPRWNEFVKLTVKNHYQENIYLRFLFFNRKMNDKAKTERGPFALSFVPLLRDFKLIYEGEHDLIVYKLDPTKFEEHDVSYISLPSYRHETKTNPKFVSKLGHPFLSISEKNYFVIHMKMYSTVLTHNQLVINVLQWKMNKLDTRKNLKELMNSNDVFSDLEILRMLPFICDTLFEIWDELTDLESQVFKTLIHVLKATHEPKLRSFDAFFDNYLRSFCYNTAYSKLINQMIFHLENANEYYEEVGNIFKSLNYLMAIIVSSKICNDSLGLSDNVEFYILIQKFLHTVSDLMTNKEVRITIQNRVVQNIASFIPHLTVRGIFDISEITNFVSTMMDYFGNNIVHREKLNYIENIINSRLFEIDESRCVILPKILIILQDFFSINFNESIDFGCIVDYIRHSCRIISTIIKFLFPYSALEDIKKPGDQEDFMLIVWRILRPLNSIIIKLLGTRYDKCFSDCITVFYSILDMFSAETFLRYVEEHENVVDAYNMTYELSSIAADLITEGGYPKVWKQMYTIQRKTTAKIFMFLKEIFIIYFTYESFDEIKWKEFIKCVVTLCIKANESWSSMDESEKEVIRSTVISLRSLWYEMPNEQKGVFIPSIVGDLLRVAAIDDEDIRGAITSIFIDMMVVNYHTKGSKDIIDKIECEMIRQLDLMLEENYGDNKFRIDLIYNLKKWGENDRNFYNLRGQDLFEKLDNLLILLLEYKFISSGSDCLENYSIQQYDLYVRYIYKLYNMNMLCDNKVEAALTLLKHAELLNWSQEPLPEYLYHGNVNRKCTNHIQLKELLYIEIADLLDAGCLWEKAIEILKELTSVYESITYDYQKLSLHYNRLSELYKKITTVGRIENSYYLVNFYGKDFPPYINGGSFVFKDIERRSAFQSKLINSYGICEIVNKMDDVSNLKDEKGRFIQIIPIKAIPTSRKILDSKTISHDIKWYYKYNGVCKFEYGKKKEILESKWTTLEDTETTRMWVLKTFVETVDVLPFLMPFSKVRSISEPILSCPLDEAIIVITQMNDDLYETASKVYNNPLESVSTLSGKIRGIVQAFVMGGVKNYNVFFSKECFEICDDSEKQKIEELRDLLIRQIVIIEYSLFVHASRASQISIPFHQSLVDSYYSLKKDIESKFSEINDSLLNPGDSIVISEPSTEKTPSIASMAISSGRETLFKKASQSVLRSPLHTLTSLRSSKSNLYNDENNVSIEGTSFDKKLLENFSNMSFDTTMESTTIPTKYRKQSSTSDVRFRKIPSIYSDKSDSQITSPRTSETRFECSLNEVDPKEPTKSISKTCLMTEL
ncbi:Myoblast city [Strongyloides ratti]|uniref:Myoblast city n=1 Tax=Strongyloides ratti TaxID=34506 RepID=A0A090LBY2_STRRB|nr:Myoblast city [Strongyloides ratti]CEF67247.1 Myoblast city [Strongyloides ratti]